MAPDAPSKVPIPGIEYSGSSIAILTVVLLYAVFVSLWILLSHKAVVADDGIGLASGFVPSMTSTLGLTPLSNLADQLGGQLAVEQPPAGGTVFRVVFPGSGHLPLRGES
jgi:two-component sensor histidine kinase